MGTACASGAIIGPHIDHTSGLSRRPGYKRGITIHLVYRRWVTTHARRGRAVRTAADGPGPATTRPLPGSDYPLALRTKEAAADPTTARTTGIVLIVVVLAAYFLVVPLINTVVVGLGWLAAGRPGGFTAYLADAATFAHPSGLLGTQLAIAALTLLVWLLYRFAHHRRLPWLWSVTPGVRWRYALACLLASLVVFGALAAWTALRGPGANPPANWGWYLAFILVTTPFQALGEEVLFRGYLMQLCGTLVRSPWFAIAATSVVFALFHGTQSVWLFCGRLVFGLAAGVLVWRTGGLEAGVVAHTVNNLATFLVALFTGTIVQARTMTTVSLSDAFLDTAVFVVVAAACWLIARAMRVPRVVGLP